MVINNAKQVLKVLCFYDFLFLQFCFFRQLDSNQYFFLLPKAQQWYFLI